MLQTKLSLNEKVLSGTPDMMATRIGFGDGLLEAAKNNPAIVGLCADLTESTQMHKLKEAFPDRYIEIGIAEQNMAAVAAGMAAMGKIPFISSYAMFSPGRNWEQIRTTAAYNNQPVKVVGSHAGISVGPDGGTHQAIEDMALMRIIPRMVVVSPCDHHQARLATLAIAENGHPSYLRLAREKTAVITTPETPFELGKAQELWRSDAPKVTLIATGTLVHNALVAAQKLQEQGIGSLVLNIHTIKPLDEQAVLAAALETGAIVSIEEHQVAGGLGSAIAEVLAKHHPTKQAFIGVQDDFGQSGSMTELWKYYKLTAEDIIETAKGLLK
jgi:transketolase